jgi:hypothetical protein
MIADPLANDGNTLLTVDLATLEGRLTAAILEVLENSEVGGDWPQRVAREVLLHLAAELTAHEQLAMRSLTLADTVQFLAQEYSP